MSALTTLNLNVDRLVQLQHFLQQSGFQGYHCHFLAGDASFRKYYRIENGVNTYVVMDAPFPERPDRFKYIAELLICHNFSAPKIIKDNLDLGFLALEDFGNTTYTKILTQENTKELYTLAVDTLIKLHQEFIVKPLEVKEYTVAENLREASIFMEWYYPTYVKTPLTPDAQESFTQCWRTALEKTVSGPHSLVLRDYHVDNLIWLKERTGVQQCGLLDFQDALWGSVTYDLVSLLEDARLDVAPELREAMWQRYTEAFPQWEAAELKRIGTILSAARHTKILGIFTRLAKRDGKPHYLPHLPRLWGYLKDCLELPDLSDVKAWFNHYVPEWQKGLPQ